VKIFRSSYKKYEDYKINVTVAPLGSVSYI